MCLSRGWSNRSTTIFHRLVDVSAFLAIFLRRGLLRTTVYTLGLNGSSDYRTDKRITRRGYRIFRFAKGKKLFNASRRSRLGVYACATANEYAHAHIHTHTHTYTRYILERVVRSCSIHSKAFNNQYYRRAECNIFLYPHIERDERNKKKKGTRTKIRYTRRRVTAADGRRFDLLLPEFFSRDIIARRAYAIFASVQSSPLPPPSYSLIDGIT